MFQTQSDKLTIRDSGLGKEVTIKFITDLGSERTVNVTVNHEGLNVAGSAGSLNAAGVQALKDALAVAEVIQRYQ